MPLRMLQIKSYMKCDCTGFDSGNGKKTKLEQQISKERLLAVLGRVGNKRVMSLLTYVDKGYENFHLLCCLNDKVQ